MFIPHVLPLVDPHLYPSLTTIRAELTLHVFLEAFLDNPVTTESSLPFLISILHYCNQKHKSDFFFFMPARSQKTSGEKRKQDRARNQGYSLGRQKREGKASPTEEKPEMWEWAGLAFWFREEELQVENTEKIILAELEERKEWEPAVPGSQCCHNRHRPSVCVLGPQLSALVTPH